MLTETRPVRQRTAPPVLWALTSGIAGLEVNVLLVLFFLLAQPFGVNGPLAGEEGQDFMWLGSANDVVIVVQFLTFIPVALALRRWLAPTRSVRLVTAAAAWAMAAVAILESLLVIGVLEFDVQVVPVAATFRWLRLGARGQLDWPPPRHSATVGHPLRVLLGASYPVGLSSPRQVCSFRRVRRHSSPSWYRAPSSQPSAG